jgi:hypothetical protein
MWHPFWSWRRKAGFQEVVLRRKVEDGGPLVIPAQECHPRELLPGSEQGTGIQISFHRRGTLMHADKENLHRETREPREEELSRQSLP